MLIPTYLIDIGGEREKDRERETESRSKEATEVVVASRLPPFLPSFNVCGRRDAN